MATPTGRLFSFHLEMMRESKTFQGHILKGKPIFRRHLYISSVLFLAIIVVTGLVLVRLAMDSLADRINSRMTSIAALNAQQIRDQIQSLADAASSTDRSTDERPDVRIKSFLDSLLSEQEEVVYIFIQDVRGDIRWESIRRGMELEQNHFSKILFSPRNPRPPSLKLPMVTKAMVAPSIR